MGWDMVSGVDLASGAGHSFRYEKKKKRRLAVSASISGQSTSTQDPISHTTCLVNETTNNMVLTMVELNKKSGTAVLLGRNCSIFLWTP